MPNNDREYIHATPVAEGVRIQVGNATAFAVRQESKDVALRLRREYHPARDAMERVPFLRGIVRLVGGEHFGQIFITDTNRSHLDRILASLEGDNRIFLVEKGRPLPDPHSLS